jgi:hypothetical protein
MPVALYPSDSDFQAIQKIRTIQASSGSSGESRVNLHFGSTRLSTAVPP